MYTEQQLLSVQSLATTIDRKFPVSLSITVSGEAPSAGFTNVHLEPFHYSIPPFDGIYEFSLVGSAPDNDEIAEAQYVEAAVFHWDNLPGDLKGVRVHADTNSMQQVLFEVGETIEGLF